MVVFSTGSIMMDLPPRCFGYCVVDRTRCRFLQIAWPRTPAAPPTAKKWGHNRRVSALRRAVEKANHWRGGLLGRRERPRGGRAAEQRNELAPPHSITSSARASSVGGTSRPSILAVLRLITNSNLVGCSTGRSPGFA